MHHRLFLKIRKGLYSPFLIALVSIVAILSSGYALSIVYDFHIAYFTVALTAIFGFLVLRNGCYFDKKNSSLVILFVCAVLICFAAHGFANINSYLLQICVALLALELSTIYGKHQIIQYFIKTMTIVSIIAIVFHILVNSFGLVLPVVNGFTRSYGNAYVYFYIVGRAMRNCGIFWEPSIFASYVVLAILFALCEDGINKKLFRLVVFTIAIMTANSSTGFALFLLCVVMLFLRMSNNKSASFGVREIFSLGIIVILVLLWIKRDSIIVSFFGSNNYIVKLLTENVEQSTRYIAVFDNFKIFLENPILGSGIDEYLVSIANLKYTDTSTSVSMLAKFGFLGATYTIMVINSGISYGRELVERILICVILLIIVNTIPHQTFLITWLLLLAMAQKPEINSYDKENEKRVA